MFSVFIDFFKEKSNNINRKNLQFCLIINFFSLLAIVFLLSFLANSNNSSYLRFGPNNKLIILGIYIDTWNKYFILQIVIGTVEIINQYIFIVSSPILQFNIFNPDKKNITEFTKFELRFYALFFGMINQIKNTLWIIISITQIDMALFKVLYSEITSYYTISNILNKKNFLLNENTNDDNYYLIYNDENKNNSIITTDYSSENDNYI